VPHLLTNADPTIRRHHRGWPVLNPWEFVKTSHAAAVGTKINSSMSLSEDRDSLTGVRRLPALTWLSAPFST
jgi:hypothetical protein